MEKKDRIFVKDQCVCILYQKRDESESVFEQEVTRDPIDLLWFYIKHVESRVESSWQIEDGPRSEEVGLTTYAGSNRLETRGGD